MCEEKGVTCEIEAIELAKMTNRTISSIICERRNYTIVALAFQRRNGKIFTRVSVQISFSKLEHSSMRRKHGTFTGLKRERKKVLILI